MYLAGDSGCGDLKLFRNHRVVWKFNDYVNTFFVVIANLQPSSFDYIFNLTW